MTPILRVRPAGPQYPYSVAQFRQDEPQLSISDNPHAAELASYGELEPPILVCRPEPVDPPEHDPATHRAVEVLPVQDEAGVWRQAWELQELPPPPEPQPQPDWATFKSGLLISADVADVMAAARVAGCEPAVTALPVALERAEQGQHSDFAACWRMVASAGGATPQMLEFLAATAEACHLPQGFIDCLDPAPAAGLIRARDDQGRFIADDPTTPENEAWVQPE